MDYVHGRHMSFQTVDPVVKHEALLVECQWLHACLESNMLIEALAMCLKMFLKYYKTVLANGAQSSAGAKLWRLH